MESVKTRPFMGYLVSQCGRVFRRGKEVKPHGKNSGYLYVDLYQSGIKHRFYLHRLVAKLHLKKPRSKRKKYINHKDGNKKNCHYLNIEWCTASENMLHAYRLGLIKRRSVGVHPDIRLCA